MFVVNHAPTPPVPAEVAQRSAFAASSPAADVQLDVDSHGYHYAVIGDHLIGAAAVTAALQRGATPKEALAALKQTYEAAGYFLVALVAQTNDKRVLLQIVSGRLTRVDGPPALVAYFEHLKGDATISSSDVFRQSVLAQAWAATNSQLPQIAFSPAAEAGGSVITITQKPLENSHSVGGSLTVGNFGNRYAGHYLAQAQAYAQHDGFNLQVGHSRALTGLDENTRGAYYASSNANLSAVTPVGTFQLDASNTRYRLGNAFAPLYPAGSIKVRGGSATQLLRADEQQRWSLQEGLHHIQDSETVFGGLYTLRQQKYAVWDLHSDYSLRFGGIARQPASISLSGGFKLGAARGNAGFNHAPGSPTGHFQLVTASAGITQSIGNGRNLQFKLSGQTTTDTLPSYQQWVLGGFDNLTAYLPGTIVGDRGYLAHVTLQGAPWRPGPFTLQPSVFVEYGAARYSYVPVRTATWQSLDDAGASVTIGVPRANVSAILAYAVPLGARHVSASLRRGQQAHLSFYVQIGF